MTKIYLGERPVPDLVTTALAAAGFLVVPAEAPSGAAAGDFSLVSAAEGVTSSLRHALGNHLTSILGYTELVLRRTDLPDEVRRRMETVLDSARSCRGLLRRVEAEP